MAKKYLDTKMFKDICRNELKQVTTVKYNCGEYEVDINVKPYSTAQEKQVVAETIWACYGGKQYLVATHSPAFRLMVLYTYCDNLKLDPSNGIDAYYDLVMHTGIYNTVISAIDRDDMSELENIVWDYIRIMEERDNASGLDGALTSLIELVNEKISGFDVDKFLGDVQRVADAADDGNIVEKVLEHYTLNNKHNADDIESGGDNNGINNVGAEESNTEKD